MAQVKTYSNQKTIILPPHINYTSHFTRFKNDVLFAAARDLKKVSFILWMYFCCSLIQPQEDNLILSNLELTPMKVCNRLGISKSSYYRALQGLTKKNYLMTDGEATLAFYAIPYNKPIKERTEYEKELGIYEYSSKQSKVRVGDLYLQKAGEGNYTPLLHEQMFDKIKNLSFGALMDWLYLRSLPPGAIFLSKVATCAKTGLNEDQYLKGINELIQVGILKERKEFVYDFFPELLCDSKVQKEKEEKKEKKKITSLQNQSDESFEPLKRRQEITQEEKAKSKLKVQEMADRWLI